MNDTPIKTSTYMKLTDVVSERLHELYLTQNLDRMEYRAGVLCSVNDIVRKMANELPEERGLQLIDDLESAMLRIAQTEEI